MRTNPSQNGVSQLDKRITSVVAHHGGNVEPATPTVIPEELHVNPPLRDTSAPFTCTNNYFNKLPCYMYYKILVEILMPNCGHAKYFNLHFLMLVLNCFVEL